CGGFPTSIGHHRPDRFALMHEVESFVDAIERQHVGDQIIDIDLVFHVPIDDLRHVGAAAPASERGALPDAPCHELERPRLDLLAGARDADDHGYTPATVTALERLGDHVDIADVFEM